MGKRLEKDPPSGMIRVKKLSGPLGGVFMNNSIIQRISGNVLVDFLKNISNFYVNTAKDKEISVGEVFNKIHDFTDKLACAISTAFLECKDQDLCENGHLQRKGYVLKDYRSRTLTTSYGSVTFRRSYWTDMDSNTHFMPLDTLFLIPKYKRFDDTIRVKLAQKAAMYGSYERTAVDCGIGISKTTIRNFVSEVYEQEAVYANDDFLKALEDKPSAIYIEADEDHIKCTGGKSKFMKLVYVHEGYKEVRKGRRTLINPKFFAGLYQGQSNAKLWENVYDYVSHRYGNEVRIIYSSDEGSWLQYGADFLPNCTHVLDLFHAAKACRLITQGIENLDWSQGNPVLNRAISGDITGFNALINEILSHVDDPDRLKIIRSKVKYIREHIEELKPYDLGITPGDSTEGHISHYLSERFSSRPMTWSDEGAEALASVRMMTYNQVDILGIRKEKQLMERKNLRQEKSIAIDRRKLKRHKVTDKYYETLQGRVSTANFGLQIIVNYGL